MNNVEFESVFFAARWPNGFECPRCAHGTFYTIRTRRLPLYQCRLCKHQTTVTAGTVMDRSRTPLAKWAAAIEFLSEKSGVNAVMLSERIGVTHKTAWLMLRGFRLAISEVENARVLGGHVYAGLQALGPYSTFFNDRHYKNERVILLTASMNQRTDEVTAIALTPVPTEFLKPESKRLSAVGASIMLEKHEAELLRPFDPSNGPLRACFKEAKQWLNHVYRGICSNSLPAYLNEFCFRRNTALQGLSLQEQWYKVCLRAF